MVQYMTPNKKNGYARDMNALYSLPELEFNSITLLDPGYSAHIERLPADLKTLTMACCSLAQDLVCPEGLETLDINGVRLFPALPGTLRKLSVAGCTFEDAFPAFPDSLQHLSFTNCVFRCALPALPESLRTVSLNGCTFAHAMPEIRGPLQSLSLLMSTFGGPFPAFVETVARLSVSKCKFHSFPDSFPRGMESLVFNSNRVNGAHFAVMPTLHEGVKTVEFNDVTCVPALPEGITRLKIDGVTNDEYRLRYGVTELPALPSTLKHLECSRSNVRELPELPEGLTELICVIGSLEVVPALPATLTWIRLYKHPLRELPALPAGLKKLQVDYCEITELLPLPEGLKTLHVCNTRLTEIPLLPRTLEGLNCSNNQIMRLPELNDALWILDCSHNQLTELPPLTPSRLTKVICCHNHITQLPSLEHFGASIKHAGHTALLNCSHNRITSIPPVPRRATRSGVEIRWLDLIPYANPLEAHPPLRSLESMSRYMCDYSELRTTAEVEDQTQIMRLLPHHHHQRMCECAFCCDELIPPYAINYAYWDDVDEYYDEHDGFDIIP